MNQRDWLLLVFVLLGAFVGLGVFLVFLDTAFRGKADTMWSIAGWVCLLCPIVGLGLMARRMITPAWCWFASALVYCLWYQLSAYGWSLFTGSMVLVGIGHLLAIALTTWTWTLRNRLYELLEQ